MFVRNLGYRHYTDVYDEMRCFTESRDTATADEVWIVEHPPVYTQGVAGKPEHILNPSDIPVIAVNRGGQVTYHGPGQLVIYLLLDIERKKQAVKQLVSDVEQSMLDALADLSIQAERKKNAPGVYVDGAKIGSIGLRVHKGRTYHGLSLNVDMDLSPFDGINPCGFRDMPVTQVTNHFKHAKMPDMSRLLIEKIRQNLHYETSVWL